MKSLRNFRDRGENFFFYLEVWKFESFIRSHYLLPIKSPQHEMVKKLYVVIHKSISKSCLHTKEPKPIRSLKMKLKWERTVSSQGECILKMSYTCACLLCWLLENLSSEKGFCTSSQKTCPWQLRDTWGEFGEPWRYNVWRKDLGYWVTHRINRSMKLCEFYPA